MRDPRKPSAHGHDEGDLPAEARDHLRQGVVEIGSAVGCLFQKTDAASRARTIDAISKAVLRIVRETVAGGQARRQQRGRRGDLSARERKALERVGLDDRPLPPGQADPVTLAAAEFAAIEAASLTVAEAASLLDVNESRVRQRLIGPPRTLFGFKSGRDWRVPRFQFWRGSLIPGIAEVVDSLPLDLDPVSVQRWFTSANPDLSPSEDAVPLSPLDWLRTGRSPERVAGLAAEM